MENDVKLPGKCAKWKPFFPNNTPHSYYDVNYRFRIRVGVGELEIKDNAIKFNLYPFKTNFSDAR
jgi:hypothetical protein